MFVAAEGSGCPCPRVCSGRCVALGWGRSAFFCGACFFDAGVVELFVRVGRTSAVLQTVGIGTNAGICVCVIRCADWGGTSVGPSFVESLRGTEVLFWRGNA